MKLDDKIRAKRIAYFLKGDTATAFKLVLLYFILAKRRTAGDKIKDACLKSIQWLERAEIRTPESISQFETSDQLELLEKILVQNKAMICQKAALVHAVPIYNRDFGLAYI